MESNVKRLLVTSYVHAVILPIIIQLFLFTVGKRMNNFYFEAIDDNSIVNTLIAYAIIGTIASTISAFSRKDVIAFLPCILIAFSLVCLWFLSFSDHIEGVGALGYSLFFQGMHIWSLFYGLSTIPSAMILLLRKKRHHPTEPIALRNRD